MTLQKLNIPPKTDNAAKKQMVQSNVIGANETLLASEVNAIVAKTNELVDATNNFIAIEGFEPVGRVATYDGLNTLTNLTKGDAYQVDTDGLIYIWNGTAFQSQTQGFDLNVKPRGKIKKGDLLAVNGDEIQRKFNQLGYDNEIKNSSFNSVQDWLVNNNNFLFNVENGFGHINTQSVADAAIIQYLSFIAGKTYVFEARIKKNSENDSFVRLGVYNVGEKSFDINSNEWQIIRHEVFFDEDINDAVFLFSTTGSNVDFYIDYISAYELKSNSFVESVLFSEQNLPKIKTDIEAIGQSIINKNFDFSSGLNKWNKNESAITFSVLNENLKVITSNSANDPAIYQFVNANVVGKTYYCEIKLKKISEASSTFRIGIDSLKTFTINNNDWNVFQADISVQNIENSLLVFAPLANTEYEIEYFKLFEINEVGLAKEVKVLVDRNKPWLPEVLKLKSPNYTYLKPFVDKYENRQGDVTIVQIGDSISTNLKWSPEREDANERPPFCTEHNINSYLEEKLRWKEQKYRRFDYEGIFTEILGEGTSTIKETDPNWGFVGDAYYYPITKVIDGGTNAGVSFKMPAEARRLSLIVHTDKEFTQQTQITVSTGNDRVEVWNGSDWVEANGYILSLREDDTLATLGFYKDNAQKRIQLRSLWNPVEKEITIQNIGAGRFGYWGIEYSPYEHMFTYICASKGSHNIAMLEKYESWMVDELNPDLILWQLPILNQNLGVAGRGIGSKDFNLTFINKYDALIYKGYLVQPYTLWAATYSNFIDKNGNFLSSKLVGNGDFVSCGMDVDNITYHFNQIEVPCINLFHRITEVAQSKAKYENSNIYKSALIGSDQDGDSFTIDGIHFNMTGELVAWRLLEPYFNF